MAYDIPDTEPARVRAGDTLTWTKSLADYPAGQGWVLHYRLINASYKYDVDATASGDDHLVSVAAATSAAYVAGDYTWVSWVTLNDERRSVAQGRITINPDLAAAAAGVDTRSTARKALDLVDAALLAHGAMAWTKSYAIGDTSKSFESASDFMAFRARLQAEVRAEENAERIRNGERPRNTLQVRFR